MSTLLIQSSATSLGQISAFFSYTHSLLTAKQLSLLHSEPLARNDVSGFDEFDPMWSSGLQSMRWNRQRHRLSYGEAQKDGCSGVPLLGAEKDLASSRKRSTVVSMQRSMSTSSYRWSKPSSGYRKKRYCCGVRPL